MQLEESKNPAYSYEKKKLQEGAEKKMNKPFPVLGFDIGGTKIAICLAMSDGTVVASGRVDNKMKKPDEDLPQVVAEGRTHPCFRRRHETAAPRDRNQLALADGL